MEKRQKLARIMLAAAHCFSASAELLMVEDLSIEDAKKPAQAGIELMQSAIDAGLECQ